MHSDTREKIYTFWMNNGLYSDYIIAMIAATVSALALYVFHLHCFSGSVSDIYGAVATSAASFAGLVLTALTITINFLPRVVVVFDDPASTRLIDSFKHAATISIVTFLVGIIAMIFPLRGAAVVTTGVFFYFLSCVWRIMLMLFKLNDDALVRARDERPSDETDPD